MKDAYMLFSQPLLTVSPIEMMKLWGDLVECYHDVNQYGGNVAEIYAYRFMSFNPTIHSEGLKPENKFRIEKEVEIVSLAANALASICEEFSRNFDCIVTINDLAIAIWLCESRRTPFHRAHVCVRRDDKASVINTIQQHRVKLSHNLVGHWKLGTVNRTRRPHKKK